MVKMHSNLGPGKSNMLLNPVSEDFTAGHNFLFFLDSNSSSDKWFKVHATTKLQKFLAS